MGGIPLAALAVQQPPSALDQAAKVLQLRNLGNAGQTQQPSRSAPRRTSSTNISLAQRRP